MLAFYVEEFTGYTIIHMNGLLTSEYLDEVEEKWEEELEKSPDMLVFDLKEVVDIDSISLNHIFKLAKRAAAQDVKLILCDASEKMKTIFEIVKLDLMVTMMTYQKFHEEYTKWGSIDPGHV